MAKANALRTCVVLDYQNMHLTAHGLYDSTRYGPKHDCLLDPITFAVNLINTRNSLSTVRLPTR